MAYLNRFFRSLSGLLWLFYYKICYSKSLRFPWSIKVRYSIDIEISGGVIEIGPDVFFNRNCSLNSRNKISIGKGTLFGENVKIYDHDHLHDLKSGVSPYNFRCEEIAIGDNCWFGSNTIILRGAKIGDHVIAGANSVLRGKIQSGSRIFLDTKKSQTIIAPTK